jgi:predicted O-methyltransferase YrrM
LFKNYRSKYIEEKKKSEDYRQKYLHANHFYQHFKTQFAPGHFYSPYPDLKDIKRRKKDIFDRRKRPIAGIEINEKQQLNLLKKISAFYKSLPYKGGKTKKYRYHLGHHAYSYTDGIMLFCLLNHLKPRRIIEVGSGFSSALMMDFNEFFNNSQTDITFIEPYPELLHSMMKDGDGDNYTVIDKTLDRVDNSLFASLGKDDVLFIDSTHVSKAGSDVNQIFFEILPLLKPGVVIHIHDVFYPFEYPEAWIKETRAWNEDYLLRAFLHNNKSYEIMIFNHFLNIHHTQTMKKLMPLTAKNYGGGLWLRKVS